MVSVAATGCSDDKLPETPDTGVEQRDAQRDDIPIPGSDAGQLRGSEQITYRSASQPITKLADAAPGAFVPPFEVCRDPVAGDSATRADGKVWTNVAVAACTEEGKYYPDYADCAIVRRQRPYWPALRLNIVGAKDPSELAAVG